MRWERLTFTSPPAEQRLDRMVDDGTFLQIDTGEVSDRHLENDIVRRTE